MTQKPKPQFVVGNEEQGSQSTEKTNRDSLSEVEKAKQAAEIQKYETERIESQRQAVFAQNDIKDTEDLKVKIQAFSERESQLGRDVLAFENKKATELSEIQKQKAELEKKGVELNKRAQDIASREANVELREKLVAEREELMNSVERKNLEETEKFNSLTEQLRRAFPQIKNLMGKNANTLIRVGFRSLGDSLWDEIEKMEEWHKNDIGKHTDTIVLWLKGEVEDCNSKAVEMARNPKQYGDTMHNVIVDNLEEIYVLLPVLKPEYLPKDED